MQLQHYYNYLNLELDANLGDLYAMISDREIEIMQELSAIVLEYTVQFLEISNALSELDWYFTFKNLKVQLSIQTNYIQVYFLWL